MPAKVFFYCLIILLIACSGDEDNSGISGEFSCSVAGQNEFVHKAMLDRYYWYDLLPASIDYNQFDSPEATLDFLKDTNSFDRFSYVTSQAAFTSLFAAGEYIGYGFSYQVNDDNTVQVKFIYDNSPVGRVNLQRGDEILSLNGESVADVISANAWNTVFGATEVGVPLSLEVRRKSGLTETLDVTKDIVQINTVLHSEVINGVNHTVGYLVFNSFLSTSLSELETVFGQFKAAGVNRLILDLRYNGGGSVSVGRDLASYIYYPASNHAERYVLLKYSDKQQHRNFSYQFKQQLNSLVLNEVSIIETQSTCSASEQVISALNPYLGSVTTIGSTSCGKPVGMNPQNFCDQALLAINFASFNQADQGEYFDGIEADCSAEDDVNFAFGDLNEPMLKSALHFVNTQSCLAARSKPARQIITPAVNWMRQVIGAV